MPNPRRFIPTKPRPSGEGRVLFRALGSQLIAQKWPKPRGKTQAQATRDWGEYFGAVNQHFAFLHPLEWRGWMNTTVAGRLYPRDLYTAAAMGRGFGIQRPDGTLIMPARALYDLSRTLDLFSSQPGALMYRTAEGWRGIEPGTPDQVLTIDAATGLPVWAAGGGGGGSSTQFPTPPPVNQWNTEWTNANLDTDADDLGGYYAVLDNAASAGADATLEWDHVWTGERVVIGFDVNLHADGDCQIAFYCRDDPATYYIGPGIEVTGDFPVWLQEWYAYDRAHPGYGNGFNYLHNGGRMFLGLERDGSDLHMLIGPTPNTMRIFDTSFYGNGWADYETLGIKIRKSSTSKPGLAMRLMHCDIGGA